MRDVVLRLAGTASVFVLAVSATLPVRAEDGPLPRKLPFDLAGTHVKREVAKSKILFGSNATAGAYPFQVSLIRADAKRGAEFDRHMCGGTLIASDWVLTAAHCVTSGGEVVTSDRLNVYVGSQDFRGGERMTLKAVFRHPKYQGETFDNDVALLQLSKAPKASAKIANVALVDQASEATLVASNAPLRIVGWGTTENDELSRVLQQADVQAVERGRCNGGILDERLKRVDDQLSDVASLLRITKERQKAVRDAVVANAGTLVTDNMICAGVLAPAANAERVTDTCQGDSGGPILAKTTDNKFVQVGIVSWGEGCGIPKTYGVYTRLSNYMDWVKATARN